MRSRLSSLLLLIATIGIIIIIHEFGHFVMANLFGVRTPVFSIGFGPALAKFKVNDTTFQIAALPLGGYVSMDVNQLTKIPYWQKMVIILAGIFNNILLAFIALVVLFFMNRAKATPVIARVMAGSPATHAGLHHGDRIVAINGQSAEHVDTIMHTVQHAPGKEITITIDRSGDRLEIPVKLASRQLIGTTIGYLGTEFAPDPYHKLTVFEAIKKAWQATMSFIKVNMQIIVQLFSIKRDTKPADFSMFAAKNIQVGFGFFLFFIAFTSVQVGLFNLLPIPMLDGGQAFDYTLQALLGHALTPEQISILHYAIIMLLVLLILFISRRKKS